MPPSFTPILIAFPETDKNARRVAGQIASTLREESLETELHGLGSLPALARFGAVVIGATFDGGEWQAAAGQFLAQNRARLILLPVAVYALDIRGAHHHPHDRHELLQELSRYRWLHPIAAEVFRTGVPRVPSNGKLRANAQRMTFDAGAVQSWAHLVAQLLTPVTSR